MTCILSNGSDLSSNVEDSQAKLTLDVHELLDVPLPENCLSHDPPSAFNFSDRWRCFVYFIDPTASVLEISNWPPSAISIAVLVPLL